MTPLALSALINSTPRLLARLLGRRAEFLTGIQEARGMALLYQSLASLTDSELAVRGVRREDIPRAVLATIRPDGRVRRI
jgi:hypothetical protein